MKELLEYRAGLIGRLVAATDEFCSACLAMKDIHKPRVEDEWDVHRVAVHLRDVHKLVYDLRARRTVKENNPEFQSFDPDAHMADHYSATEPLPDILSGLRRDVNDLAAWLRKLPVQAWSRESRHATLGNGFTLQSWVERDLAHIEEHIENLRM